ncbi:MAG: hypothetical protein ACR2NN_01995 [Bryobacteraceae bacterium]
MRTGNRRKVVLLALIPVFVFVWLMSRRPHPEAGLRKVAAPPDNTHVQRSNDLLLQVRHDRNGLQVSWDSGSALIQQSASGTVHILDGKQQLDIPIDAATLRLGHFAYQPVTSDISIEMIVTAKGGAQVRDEVYLIDGRDPILARAVPSSLGLPRFTLAMPPIEQLPRPPIAAAWHPPPPDSSNRAPN